LTRRERLDTVLKKDPSGHDDTGRTRVEVRNYWVSRDQGNHSGIKKKKHSRDT